ncbi:hypothetical protein [Actinoplanes sp. NPDC051859]|uniref:hypothetical protein n=1 Tax=Actinoplanes sp. NPDC051859 TaxID=3363909 RepID=UPI0037AA77FF
MIFASLLLILVAVTLLVLGLAGGSSSLLTSSIVASLLAAVALVIGARQASTGRRAVGEPLPADQPDPPYVTTADSDRYTSAEPDAYADQDLSIESHAGTPAYAGVSSRDFTDADSYSSAAFADNPPGVDPLRAEAQRDDASHDEPDQTESAVADDPDRAAIFADEEPDRAAAYAAGQHDADAVLGDSSRAADRPGPDVTQRIEEDGEPAPHSFDDDLHRGPYPDLDLAGGRRGPDQSPSGRRATEEDSSADYDQASSMIGGARAEDDASWRRSSQLDSAADFATVDADSPLHDSQLHDSQLHDSPVRGAAGSAFAAHERSSFADGDERSMVDDSDERSVFAVDGERSGLGEAEVGDFGDPDPDDPDDEPLPQKVRPADAVRVARLDADVVVVDGRPRYHVSDCSHLSGRQTEGLPVAEAVELGFSPCGRCRPVDRLVAAAARR